MAQGAVKTGEKAFLEPGHKEVRVRSVQSHGESAETGEKGRRTALNLVGIKTEEVRRGMAVGEPGALFETKVLDAKVRWSVPPRHGLRVRISVGADEAIGKLFLSDGDPGLAQLRLENPIACALGQPVIIRRYSPPDVLGGGRIVVPQAKPRRKSEKASLVEAEGGESEAILRALEDNEEGLTTEEICRRLGKSPQALGDIFESLRKDQKVAGFASLWFEPQCFLKAITRFIVSLKELHEQKPMQSLQPREAVLKKANLNWSGKPLDRILAALASSGKLRVEGTGVRLPSFKIALTERQRAFLDRVVETLDAAGANPPGAMDLSSSLHVPHQAVEEILKLGVEAGEVVRVADGIYFSPKQLALLKKRVQELAASGLFTAAEFRDAAGTSRKYAIPLLEHFDATRVTMRVGDKRALVKAD